MLLALTILMLTCAAISAAGVHTNRPNQDMFRGHRRGDQSWQWNYRAWMPAVWIRLAQCESGSNPPDWQHDSGTYTGGFGFYIGSWRAFKPVAWWPDRASQASPWMQFQVALRIHARFGFSGWGCYQGAAHAWVRG